MTSRGTRRLKASVKQLCFLAGSMMLDSSLTSTGVYGLRGKKTSTTSEGVPIIANERTTAKRVGQSARKNQGKKTPKEMKRDEERRKQREKEKAMEQREKEKAMEPEQREKEPNFSDDAKDNLENESNSLNRDEKSKFANDNLEDESAPYRIGRQKEVDEMHSKPEYDMHSKPDERKYKSDSKPAMKQDSKTPLGLDEYPFSLFVFSVDMGMVERFFPPQLQKQFGVSRPIHYLPHTAVYVHGKLYSLEQGPDVKNVIDEKGMFDGIYDSFMGNGDKPDPSLESVDIKTLRSDPRFRKEITGGRTKKTAEELKSFLDKDLNPDWIKGGNYNLLNNNCNHYADKIVRFLNGGKKGVPAKGIPGRFLDIADRIKEAKIMQHPMLQQIFNSLGGKMQNPFAFSSKGKRGGDRKSDGVKKEWRKAKRSSDTGKTSQKEDLQKEDLPPQEQDGPAGQNEDPPQPTRQWRTPQRKVEMDHDPWEEL